jgi:hypothetical protein
MLRAAVLALAPLVLITLVAPWLPLGDRGGALLAFGCAIAAVVLAATQSPALLWQRPRAVAIAVAFGVVLALTTIPLLTRTPIAAGLLGALAVFTAATALGTLIGSRVESPGHVLPVALLSAAVDLWSVTAASGPTHAILSRPTLLRLLTITVAVPPSRLPEPQIGFGDVVFSALYVAIGVRFALSRMRTTLALTLGIAAAGLASAFLEAPVPALPMLGLAMVLLHPQARRVPPEDRRVTAATALLLVASAAKAAMTLTR